MLQSVLAGRELSVILGFACPGYKDLPRSWHCDVQSFLALVCPQDVPRPNPTPLGPTPGPTPVTVGGENGSGF